MAKSNSSRSALDWIAQLYTVIASSKSRDSTTYVFFSLAFIALKIVLLHYLLIQRITTRAIFVAHNSTYLLPRIIKE